MYFLSLPFEIGGDLRDDGVDLLDDGVDLLSNAGNSSKTTIAHAMPWVQGSSSDYFLIQYSRGPFSHATKPNRGLDQ